MEHAYPLRVETYALRQGSGGSGKFRGGRGIVRDVRVLGENVTVSVSGERQQVAAPGMDGGGNGALGEFIINPDGPRERKLSSAVSGEKLPPGTIIRVATPGGGGWGKA
ncbi:MAG: hypothetical protein CMM47_01485 [Rhodospirillaceae bacterium]|nr:hypothetical protein [Rhodospirillaceae bacterium]